MMQRTLLVAAVVVLVALSGVGATTAADATATQSDVVTVELSVSTPDGESVGNAQATIEWDGGSTTAETSSNGRDFADVPRGADLEITLTHDEYVKNVPETVSGVSGDQVVETTMHPAATGEIRVEDANGAAVEGATVRLHKDGRSTVAASGTTNAEGVYESPEVEEGDYTVSVRQPGYYDASRSATLSGDANATVGIEQGEVTVGFIVQDPTPRGSGVVSANLDVRLDGERIYSTTTDEQDRRSLGLDVNREYDVEISKEGYTRSIARLQTGEQNRQETFNITRSPAISLTAGNEQVVVGQRLRVEVTDQYNRSVEDATVLVGGEAAGETDDQGVASVLIDTEGEVDVTAESDGLTAPAATVTGVAASDDDQPAEPSDSDSGDGDESDANGDGDDNGSDDGGTGSGSPGFGAGAAIVGALAAVALLARRR